jgi:hypothetical protein
MRTHLAPLLLAGLAACTAAPGEPTPDENLELSLAPAGIIRFEIDGLPPGVPSDVWAVGPAGEAYRVLASTALGGLSPGDWQVVGFEVVSQGVTYAPAIAPATVTVEADMIATAAIAYSVPSEGALRVNVSGLPEGVDPAITVTAPGGYSASLTAPQTLTGLVPGPYSASAAPVSQDQSFADFVFDLASSTLPADVFAGELAQGNLVYAQRPGTGTLWVPSASRDLLGYDNARLGATAGPVSAAGASNGARAVVFDRAGTAWYTTPGNAVYAAPLGTGGFGGVLALTARGTTVAGIALGRGSAGLWLALPAVGGLEYHAASSSTALSVGSAYVTVSQVAAPTALVHCGDFYWVANDVGTLPIAKVGELPMSGTTTVPLIGSVNGGGAFPDGVHGLACAPPGRLFAALGSAGKIIRIDFEEHPSLDTWEVFTVGGNPSGVAVDEAGNVWFTDPAAGKIAFIDAATASGPGAVFTPVTMATQAPFSLGHLAFDPPPIGATLVR